MVQNEWRKNYGHSKIGRLEIAFRLERGNVVVRVLRARSTIISKKVSSDFCTSMPSIIPIARAIASIVHTAFGA